VSKGNEMKKLFSNFMFEEAGATLVEYAIMASLIAAVAATAVVILGQTVLGLFVTATGLFP